MSRLAKAAVGLALLALGCGEPVRGTIVAVGGCDKHGCCGVIIAEHRDRLCYAYGPVVGQVRTVRCDRAE